MKYKYVFIKKYFYSRLNWIYWIALDFTGFQNDTSEPKPGTHDVSLGNQEVSSAP